MKVAIVHDWFNQKVGGAEEVVFELARMYPKADIFTLVYNPKKFDQYLGGRNIITSRLQHRPGFMKKSPVLLLGGIPRAIGRWDFSGYDVVITSSTAWVKNIPVPKGVKHICYCHSPARMMWDSWPKYLDTVMLGPLKLGKVGRVVVGKKILKLRLWDYYSSSGVSQFLANSEYIAGRIKKYYHQESRVVYPPVQVEKLKPKKWPEKQDYYLVLSVLAHYKQIELAIKAFKQSGKKLVVAGTGPDEKRLRDLAADNSNIEFLGRVDEVTKQGLLQKARAFVFCSIEDFGITMVEAVAAHTDVVALRGGGASEILVEDSTGWFFDKPTPQSLNAAIARHAEANKKLPADRFEYAYKKFEPAKFQKHIREAVGE
jgi:glycosyltransferase involved in cell wall biosynthesis